ncbi:FAD-dependent oxidoreductase [Euzebya rosea]|uniref:FAD-dependent oxidoreductase n=1 Tax=Euzebya rosea TaxID=2052804 RepID=UPI0013002216|nr:FAD-dependent oxidoreductase [Euzebya rosea]
MTSTIVIGDGPAGLSAALFLAKNDHHVTVYGGDETAMHWAHLHNYLGVPDIGGSAFQEVARQQAVDRGATLVEEVVTAVRVEGDRFAVSTEGTHTDASADYLIIAGGKTATSLAESLGIESGPNGVDTDRDGRTVVDRVYVVGRLAKPNRSQAIISAGAGASAALDILSREAGDDVHDWDSPPKGD